MYIIHQIISFNQQLFSDCICILDKIYIWSSQVCILYYTLRYQYEMYIWHFICVYIYNKSDYIMQPAIIQYWKVGKGSIYICWIIYITIITSNHCLSSTIIYTFTIYTWSFIWYKWEIKHEIISYNTAIIQYLQRTKACI